MSVGTIYENFDDLKSLIERHKNEKVPYKNYEFDGTGYTLMLKDINKLLQENQQLKKQKEINRKAVDYVRENSKKYYRDWGQDDCSTEIYLDEDEVFKLLEILEDKEV